MSFNPAPIVDPNRIAESAQISGGIEANRVRDVAADSHKHDAVKILGPSADPMDDFYSEFMGQNPQPLITGGDYAAYMDYKKRKMQQLQAESLKSTIREMYAAFRAEKNFAEMEYLEKEFPFLISEKEEYVRTQQWIMENVADFYATGGKPTAKQLLFQYALKTDPRLQEMAKPVSEAFLKGDNNKAFNGNKWLKGWMSNYFYPTTTTSINFPAYGQNDNVAGVLPWNRFIGGHDYLTNKTSKVSDKSNIAGKKADISTIFAHGDWPT